MWVRTQDRTGLIEAKSIRYHGYCDHHYIHSHDLIIGEYATKERALQVLDEIQRAIQENEVTYVSQAQYHVEHSKIATVYEMPKE
jgi:hypothetical protein